MSSASYTKQGYIRYAPYVEERHSNFLSATNDFVNIALDNNPYTEYDGSITDNLFFGNGYTLSNFDALYDMFGTHMAGFDVELLWYEVFLDNLTSSEITDNIIAERALLDEKISSEDIVSFKLSMRDINAVTSSSFVIGLASIEKSRNKTIANYGFQQKYDVIDNALNNFTVNLQFNKTITTLYAEMMKGYYQHKMDVDDMKYTNDSNKTLWPFLVLDFEGLALNALKGKSEYNKYHGTRKRSELSKGLLMQSAMISGMFSGMYYGSALGGPYGALIGISVGFNIGIAQLMYEHPHGDRMAARYWLTGGMSGPWDLAFEPIF